MSYRPRLQTRLTERRVQLALYRRFNKRKLLVPNIYLYGENESDLVTVTKAGYVDEFEIKLSRRDFYQDQKKHRHVAYTHRSPWKHTTISGSVPWSRVTLGAQYPNRFWYVVPEGMVDRTHLPEYAGLMYVRSGSWPRVWVEVQAPKLHSHKIKDREREKILLSVYFRYITEWGKGR